MPPVKLIIIFLLTILILPSCANKVKKALKDVKYSAWEKVGVEKRDIFKREVSNVKDDQDDSGEAFKDALTKLKEVYSFEGGNLEREYNKLSVSYDDAQDEAKSLSESIQQLNTVAQDLFVEWEGELKEISSADLKKQSSGQLRETKANYKKLHRHLKESESKMNPVLVKLKDQVLFLKHNLNAKAIGGLKREGQKIENDIESLIEEMDKSSREAEKFIKTL